MPVYLDYAASAPLRPRAKAVLLALLEQPLGNPTGAHSLARKAKDLLETSRERVASAFGLPAKAVIFTSSATEANNLAVLGTSHLRGGPIAVSAIEHKSVLRPAEEASRRQGTDLIRLPVTPAALLDIDRVADLLPPSTSLVSVMAVNNEVGTIQPLGELARLLRQRCPAAVVHVDAAQAIPWINPTELARVADLVTLSSHKVGGPLGIGALVVCSDNVQLSPLILGGGQERGMRAGTPAPALAAGMAEAFSEALDSAASERERVTALRDRLADLVVEQVPGSREATPRMVRSPSTCPLVFERLDSQELLWLLDDAGLCAAAGSSCASGALERSHVLDAMGIDGGTGFVRLSLGWATTAEEVDFAAEALVEAVGRLRHTAALLR
jgi:cysteine desulfurase